MTCAVCVADGRGESRWVLETSAEAAAAAELDDAPYTDLAREASSPFGMRPTAVAARRAWEVSRGG